MPGNILDSEYLFDYSLRFDASQALFQALERKGKACVVDGIRRELCHNPEQPGGGGGRVAGRGAAHRTLEHRRGRTGGNPAQALKGETACRSFQGRPI